MGHDLVTCCAAPRTGDPLRVYTRPDDTPPFHLSYIKGCARSTTLLSLLLLLLLAEMEPPAKLLETAQYLVAVFPCPNPDPETVLFMNAQLAQRGAIRKGLDVFSWVAMIQKITHEDAGVKAPRCAYTTSTHHDVFVA